MVGVTPVEETGGESFFGGNGVLSMIGSCVGGVWEVRVSEVSGFVALECWCSRWMFFDCGWRGGGFVSIIIIVMDLVDVAA